MYKYVVVLCDGISLHSQPVESLVVTPPGDFLIAWHLSCKSAWKQIRPTKECVLACGKFCFAGSDYGRDLAPFAKF